MLELPIPTLPTGPAELPLRLLMPEKNAVVGEMDLDNESRHPLPVSGDADVVPMLIDPNVSERLFRRDDKRGKRLVQPPLDDRSVVKSGRFEEEDELESGKARDDGRLDPVPRLLSFRLGGVDATGAVGKPSSPPEHHTQLRKTIISTSVQRLRGGELTSDDHWEDFWYPRVCDTCDRHHTSARSWDRWEIWRLSETASH